MSTVTIRKTFKVDGVLTDVTSVKLSDPTDIYGVKRNDTDAVVVANNTSMVKISTGVYSYTFTEPSVNLTYTYWVEWFYNGETYREEGTVSGSTSGLSLLLSKQKYVDWITTEFQPIELITPPETIEQCVDNAVRYWNTHSAYRVGAMVAHTPGTTRVQLPACFKSVVEIMPNKTTTWIWSDHPLWTLTGVMLLDNVTSDLIMMSEAFRNYRKYVGMDFRWTFEPNPDDPTEGGYLYTINVPPTTTSLFVVGTKRIVSDDDVKSEYINDWLLRYIKALVKQIEGNSMRKTAIILPGGLDGDTMVKEGMEEAKALQEELRINGRWVLYAKRY